MIDTRKRALLVEGLELCERLAAISGELDWPHDDSFYRGPDLEAIRAQVTTELTQLEQDLLKGGPLR